MDTTTKIRKQIHWLPAIMATIATALVIGGPLTLAEHYAHAGAVYQMEVNAMAGQTATKFNQNS